MQMRGMKRRIRSYRTRCPNRHGLYFARACAKAAWDSGFPLPCEWQTGGENEKDAGNSQHVIWWSTIKASPRKRSGIEDMPDPGIHERGFVEDIFRRNRVWPTHRYTFTCLSRTESALFAGAQKKELERVLAPPAASFRAMLHDRR